MTTRRLAAVLLAAGLLGAACGRLEHGGSSGGSAIVRPAGADDLVLRWEYVGGFTAPEATLTRLPAFSLYGDGRLITEGPQIAIYPGPALPSLLVRTISEDGVQAMLSAAPDAGLTEGDATYANACVVDAPATRFTVAADGRTSVVTAGALGAGGCRGSDPAANKRLAAFVSKLGDLGWLPAGSIGDQAAYQPTGLRIYARRYTPDPELRERVLRWPGAPLSTTGRPVDAVPGLRCSVVGRADLAAVLKAASSANQLTPWTSGGSPFTVLFRPLLPDESGC